MATCESQCLVAYSGIPTMMRVTCDLWAGHTGKHESALATIWHANGHGNARPVDDQRIRLRWDDSLSAPKDG